MIKITLIKSTIGAPKAVKETVAALGLTKIRTFKIHEDNACIRGMIKKVSHLVSVENVENA